MAGLDPLALGTDSTRPNGTHTWRADPTVLNDWIPKGDKETLLILT